MLIQIVWCYQRLKYWCRIYLVLKLYHHCAYRGPGTWQCQGICRHTADWKGRPIFIVIPWLSVITYHLCKRDDVIHSGQWDLGGSLDTWCVNTLRSRQNGCHFAEDIFRCIFLNENVRLSIEIYLNIVLERQIDNSALVQIMAWHRPGDKPLSEPMMFIFTDAYMRHSASVS